MEDGLIVDMYLKRDESAIDQTAQKYGHKLRAIALRILEDDPSSEECENDTYLEAWNLIPPNEPRTYLFPFLGRITRHLALDMCRKRSAAKRSAVLCELSDEMSECLSSSDNTESQIDTMAFTETVNEFLKGLPKEQRMLFVRRYWYFDTVSDLSSGFGWSRSKVKTTLFRLREKLRGHLEKEGYRL